MAFDLSDEELKATREMNKTAWESEIDKWSKEYLIERYKDLVEIEKEHKKENGELREQVKEIEKQRNDVAWRLSNLTEKIEGILNKYKYTELGNDEEIINFYKELQELLEERN